MARRFIELDGADIVRDGGSFVADLRCEAGDSWRVYLEVDTSRDWPPGVLRHRNLYFFDRGAEPSEANEIEKGDEREALLLSELLDLAARLQRIARSLSKEEREALARLVDLCSHAQRRFGEPNW